MKKFAPYLIFVAAMLWATDAPFRVRLTRDLNSSFIVLVEHFFDIVIVLPILFFGFKELKNLRAKQWLAALGIAVGGSALASVAFTQAFHYVNPSVAILLQKLQPLIAIGLAAAILREHLTPKFWLWAAAAIFGAYLISFPKLMPQVFPNEEFNPNVWGVGLALLAAVFWGASTVLGKYVLSAIDFKLMTSLRFTLAFVFLLGLNVFKKTVPPLASVSARDWLFLMIIAVTSGVVSLLIYYKGLQYTKASVATLAELGFPMAAVLVNWIFLKAYLEPVQILGMTALLFSVFKLAEFNWQAGRQEKLAAQPVGG